jgi:hypothetical protein
MNETSVSHRLRLARREIRKAGKQECGAFWDELPKASKDVIYRLAQDCQAEAGKIMEALARP